MCSMYDSVTVNFHLKSSHENGDHLKVLFFSSLFLFSSKIVDYLMSHAFVEANFSRPTYCDQCQGLLWGLVKQGIRCSGIVL